MVSEVGTLVTLGVENVAGINPCGESEKWTLFLTDVIRSQVEEKGIIYGGNGPELSL